MSSPQWAAYCVVQDSPRGPRVLAHAQVGPIGLELIGVVAEKVVRSNFFVRKLVHIRLQAVNMLVDVVMRAGYVRRDGVPVLAHRSWR